MGNPIVNRTQKTENFHAAVFKGAMDVTVIPSADSCEVNIEAEEQVMERITMRIENGELHLKREDSAFSFLSPTKGSSANCKVRVSAPAFDYLYLKGAGKLTATDTIRGETLKVKLKGAGSVQMAMEANLRAQIKLEGTGTMQMQVSAPEVKADLEGIGNITLSGQTSRLKAELDGMGNIDAKELVAQAGKATMKGVGNITVNVAALEESKKEGLGKVINVAQK